MEHIKSFNDYNSVNEEFTFFGMDVVVLLSEYLKIWGTIAFIAVFSTAIGYMSLKSWLSDIISVRRKINDIKKLINIIEKYKDDVVDNYIHDLKTLLQDIKTEKTSAKINGVSMWNYNYQRYAEKLTNYLESKMSEEDYDTYKNILESL